MPHSRHGGASGTPELRDGRGCSRSHAATLPDVRREQVSSRARRRVGGDVTVHLDERDFERIEAAVDFSAVETALDTLPEGQAQAVCLRSLTT